MVTNRCIHRTVLRTSTFQHMCDTYEGTCVCDIYVTVCVYIYIYMYVYIYIVDMYAHIFICVRHIYICICTYTFIYIMSCSSNIPGVKWRNPKVLRQDQAGLFVRCEAY